MDLNIIENEYRILPSYIALNPWALTAKSVVKQSVRIEPVLTIDDGS